MQAFRDHNHTGIFMFMFLSGLHKNYKHVVQLNSRAIQICPQSVPILKMANWIMEAAALCH